jgi:uncharacterized membrane protein
LGEILWVWGEAFLRWLHVVAGIAWIGASFYFIHLDHSLKQGEGLPAEAHGQAWQVHGGGFYNMVKYLVAPARLPAELTWFKWEAYATWAPASPWWWRSTTSRPHSTSSIPRCSALRRPLASPSASRA